MSTLVGAALVGGVLMTLPGRATGQAVSGYVVLEGWSERVSDARVQLLDNDMDVLAVTGSDEDGSFRFPAPAPGEYYLQATVGRQSSAVVGPLTVPDPDRTEVAVTLPSELYRRALACLRPDTAASTDTTGRAESGILAGVAYDEATTTPLPGARVVIRWKDETGSTRVTDARTDGAGRFVFCEITARVPLEVRLEVLGRVGSHHTNVRVRPDAVARMDLSAALSDGTSLQVLASRTGTRPDSLATLQGRLLDASTKGPIEGASVELEGTRLGDVTDGDGGFRVSGVPPGRHTLQVSRLGYDWRADGITVDAGATVVLELRAAPAAIDLDAVVVRTTTPESRMARAATQAPRIMAGVELHRAEERAASLVDVIRQLPSLHIRRGQFESELGVERGVCIESSRALMRYAIPERKTPLPWCEMIAIIIDGVPTMRGTEMINALRLRQVESVEFLPPTGALRYGERAALNGALVIWTRGRGPHQDPDRWPGG